MKESFKENQHEMKEQNLSNIQNCWIPIKTFAEQVQWPSASALRSYAFKANELGLQQAFIRIKRRVLVNPQKFFELIQLINKTACDEQKKYPTLKTWS